MVQLLVVDQALPPHVFSQYPQTSFALVPEALDLVLQKQIDIVFVPIAIPGQAGLHLLEMVRYTGAELVVCHETADPQITEALWLGVRFFIPCTADVATVQELIERVISRRIAFAEYLASKQRPDAWSLLDESIELPDFLTHKIQAYALGADPVLIIGGPGTEWRYVAAELCRQSLYNKSFVIHYCQTTKDLLDVSFLYAAHHGVVVFADIAYFTSDMQIQLKELLLHPPVPLRLCLYASKSLRLQVAAGKMDEQLYRLISAREIALPLLRDRADFSQIIKHIIQLLNRRMRVPVEIHDDVLAALLSYSWPGNIQELIGVLSVAMRIAEKQVTLNDLPNKIKKAYLS